MFIEIKRIIESNIDFNLVSLERKQILQPLIDYIEQQTQNNTPINLKFICTHNSRRSHLAQVWTQVAAFFYAVPNVFCYSGGTEETALFPKVAETLTKQGFQIFKISNSNNPIYAIKFTENNFPIIGFSKKYDAAFNPISNFAAILTCSQADDGCPFIKGAAIRIPITFEDPKVSDHTDKQDEVYWNRSIEIAIEMMYVFSRIKNTNSF